MSEAESFAAMRARMLENLLRQVPFEGWSETALFAAAEAAGYPRELALEAFPGGVPDALEFAAAEADRTMIAALEAMPDFAAMRVRQRIAAAVRARLEPAAGHREAIRRALSTLALPHNLPLAAKTLWRTVDAIWYAAGDEAADFNYYTKRGLLAAVYSATVLYWLDDRSPDSSETWSFLERRLEEVLRVPRFLARVRERVAAALR